MRTSPHATGAFLIPGLWDMHVHSVANVAVERSLTSVAARDWHFPLFLAHGVTGVRNMNDGTGDLRLELSKSVRRQLAEGKLRGPPRFLTAGPALDGDPSLGSNPVVVRTAAEARAAVEQLVSNGADLVKVYENLSREAYFAIIDAARRRAIPVDGHVPFRVTPEEVADGGQRTVEHPDALAAGCSIDAEAQRKRFANVLADYDRLPDAEKFLAMFRHVRDSTTAGIWPPASPPSRCTDGTEWQSPSIWSRITTSCKRSRYPCGRARTPPSEGRSAVTGRSCSSSETHGSSNRFSADRPARVGKRSSLNEAGVLLLAATDVGVPFQVPGISLHVELERLVEAGLSPLEALQAATHNPARVLKMADSLGSIEPGKLADLVLLDANPLEDIRNTQKIRAVVADGRLYRRADLDRLLAEVELLNSKSRSKRRSKKERLKRTILVPVLLSMMAAGSASLQSQQSSGPVVLRNTPVSSTDWQRAPTNQTIVIGARTQRSRGQPPCPDPAWRTGPGPGWAHRLALASCCCTSTFSSWSTISLTRAAL